MTLTPCKSPHEVCPTAKLVHQSTAPATEKRESVCVGLYSVKGGYIVFSDGETTPIVSAFRDAQFLLEKTFRRKCSEVKS